MGTTDHFRLGVDLGVKRDFHGAKVEFEKALASDQSDWLAKLWLQRAEDALAKRIDEESAWHSFYAISLPSRTEEQSLLRIAEHKKAIELCPDYPPFHNDLGMTYWRLNMVDEAISSLTIAITQNPQWALVHNNLGSAYHKRKRDRDKGIEHYKKAIEIDPDYPEAHASLGLAFGEMAEESSMESERQKLFNLAINELETAIRLKPKLGTAHNDLALVYFSVGKCKLAVMHADIAAALGAPGDPAFLKMLKPYRIRWLGIGWLLFSIGVASLVGLMRGSPV